MADSIEALSHDQLCISHQNRSAWKMSWTTKVMRAHSIQHGEWMLLRHVLKMVPAVNVMACAFPLHTQTNTKHVFPQIKELRNLDSSEI